MRLRALGRELLEILLAGCIAFSSCKKVYRKETPLIAKETRIETLEQTEADLLLINFPGNIPKCRVKKYPVRGSKRLLVHVRNYHDKDDMNEDEMRRYKKVQEDAYATLSFLIENNGLKEIYGEGLHAGNIEEWSLLTSIVGSLYADLKTQKESLEQEINGLKVVLNGNQGDEERKRLILEKEEELCKVNGNCQKIQKSEVMNDVLCRLVIEGKLEVLASEDIFANRIAESIFEKSESEKINPVFAVNSIIDNREDAVLRVLSKDKKPVVYLLLGGLHTFGGDSFQGYSLEGRISHKDNIYEWNKANPDKKFSLIEITPESYR